MRGLLPENMIWSYVVQLSSALRTIHAAGLACRVMDPTKILVTTKNRYCQIAYLRRKNAKLPLLTIRAFEFVTGFR